MTETVTNPHPTPPPIGGPTREAGHADEGKVAAVIVYVLYIVGVFSANLISPIGVIVAYVSRGGAAPWVRAHFDLQIKMFWTVFWWSLVTVILAVVLFIPTLSLSAWIGLGVGLLFTIWFAVKSALGALRLLDRREP